MDLSRFHSLDIVLVCGLPGAGKSYFSKKFFADSGRKRINRKEIRRLLYEMMMFGEKWKEEYFNEHDEFLVKHVERKILEHLLQNKNRVLLDNSSVTSSSRKIYSTIARQLNRSIGVIFLNASLKKCLERNRSREDFIPEVVVTNLSLTIELPKREEGFKEILILGDE
ncbi:MAG: ATP-binding protein [Spirochaetota bacterium]